ncbi:hypothetical protein DY000_02021257 [Brassica cretica]|uniref:Replication factor A C-terminal domain-containing protein n=1 Tax=Brassica cretica TaxID=69181 RepID=A0ABQ7E046_BRACR|nr:hypothetical protein DY000_02021257 [Brassica cretica]
MILSSQSMNSNSKNSVSSDLLSKKPTRRDAVSSAASMKPSAAPMKPSAAPMKPSAAPMKPIGQSGISGDSSSKKRNGKAIVCSDVPSDKNDGVVFSKNVTFGPQADDLRFRLIHFWEARNALSKILIGLEMLLIDEEGTVIQGFIPPSRIDTYLRHMIPGSTYRLNNFFSSKTKKVYRVADPDVTIAFSWNSVLSVRKDSSIQFSEDRFRFHGYEQFEAACGLRGDLYDYIGHIRLVNEQTLNKSLVLDEVEIASMRRILTKSLGKPPSVILVTTVNPKRFGGALSMSSRSSSRVFFDMDVQPTREYLAWLESNSEVANRVNAEIVTKAETATIGELLSYMKQEEAKVAWFECTATIDDVVRDSAWYYIACGGCKTKATKGPTTLMCKKCGKAEITGAAELESNSEVANRVNAQIVTKAETTTIGELLSYMKQEEAKVAWFECTTTIDVVVRDSAWYYIACGGCKTKATKGPTTLMCKKCGKAEITGAAEYLTKLSVYDNNDYASFVVLDDAGHELTGKKTSGLVESYYEANEGAVDGHVVPVPQALIDTIGQTRTFIIKISNHNLEGKMQALTVTKVLPLEVAALGCDLDDILVVPPTAVTLETGNREEGSSIVNEEHAADGVKRGSDMIVSDDAKGAKCG